MDLEPAPSPLQFGEFTLDVRAAELRRGGRKVRLQEQPFQILAMLLACPGQLVPRDDVRRRLWPADTFVDFDHGLNNAVARLREALGDAADQPRYVETVARRGYRFVAPVTTASSSVPAPGDTGDTRDARRPGSGRRRREVITAVVAAAAVALAVLPFARSGRGARPPEASTPHRSPPAVRAEALDLYLRARYHLNRQGQADVEEAIDLLERATALEPRYALAQAELGRAYRQKAFLFAPEQKELEEKAFVAVEKALALEPDLPEGHVARGRTLWTLAQRFPHDAVIAEYRRALAANPDLDEAHYELGHVYNHVGLLEEGLAELRTAVALNPSNTQARFRIGVNLAYQGKDAEALDVLRGVPRVASPGLWGFQTASALLRLGRRGEAAALLAELARQLPRDEGGLRTSVEAILFAQSGDRRRAEERIRTALQIGRGFGHFHHTAYNVAAAYAILGDAEAAVPWLKAAAEEGFPCYPLFASDPTLMPLHGRADFTLFLAAMREQWDARRVHAHADSSRTE